MLTETIKNLCNAHGISIPKLEEKLGFGAGTISKWKKSAPGADKLVKVAEYFQVSTDYLLGLNINMPYSALEQTLLNDFRRLNNQGQDAALATIHAYTLMAIYAKKDMSGAGSI